MYTGDSGLGHSRSVSNDWERPMPSNHDYDFARQSVDASSHIAAEDTVFPSSSYSTSVGQKTPVRSFYHRSLLGPPGTHRTIFVASPRRLSVDPEPAETLSLAAQSLHSTSSASALTAMLQKSPPSESLCNDNVMECDNVNNGYAASAEDWGASELTEHAPLVRDRSLGNRNVSYGSMPPDVERQSSFVRREFANTKESKPNLFANFDFQTLNPKTWDRRTVWQTCIAHPASLLPSVFLGLLLNVLDALSYGMILFPLGSEIFKDTGADGISMFYVSTVISQLVFSCGGSIFKGGIGSEMIEVVPFFHKMAYMILERVGSENREAVFATTILSFAISSILTGIVFFIMGAFGLGTLIGFFPRHILIGCIGGVGWFLVATGIEVAGRLSGNLQYNLATLHILLQTDKIVLWTLPLALAVTLLVVKRFVTSNFLVGGYFILITILFYLVKFFLGLSMETLRSGGWVFEAPPSDNPWYHFYTFYKFGAVDWKALAATVPTMFALTFFGLLHVPINVPALGISTGEDNLSVDRELIAHGVSNALSGLCGSIQNYLVYTNSLLFIASGGSDRLAGIMLAIATLGILFIGPVIIGYIPIMVVSALIYMLGIELMEEALVDTWGKLQKLEYLTTSRKSAIIATYTGEIASSTVRRHPTHVRFLREAGRQTYIVKLTGFLFFGTIVDVEDSIRALIEEKAFDKRPIRYLVLDFRRVRGLDFSAAEAFTRIDRILSKRGVHMIICGLDLQDSVGTSLQNVGLFSGEGQVKVFENLNSALEYCENELLKALHNRRRASRHEQAAFSPILDVPRSQKCFPSDAISNSPRDRHLHEVAQETLREEEVAHLTKSIERWSSFQQPLALMMQTFQGLTKENEDFWFSAVPYFTRVTSPTNAVLFRQGEQAKSFYLLESGMLRAEYETPQGRYDELIVAGRCCGELPFFGETPRSATMRVECDCVVWTLDQENWDRLKTNEPKIAQELLRVCLKLTAERMESITSYVLTTS
ncbi:hypothetical protein KEM54_004582 [Ascosphaera aggregata]|nr:hypothetical protein KEM54_004582 [Ascosphaera aggregata]